MKRLGLMGTLGALALAALAPATASAHTPPVFWVDILKSTCVNEGGEHGFGRIKLGMAAYATNTDPEAPTPNYSIIRSKFQQKIDGVWVTIGGSSTTTPVSPDGSPELIYNLLIESFSFRSADHPKMRMIMRAVFWDDLESGDVRLGSTRVQSPAC